MINSKKRFKKTLCVVLVLGMLMNSIGCGGSNKSSSTNNTSTNSNNANSNNANTNNTSSNSTTKSDNTKNKKADNNNSSSTSEEFVYQASYTPIKEGFSNISDAIYRNDNICVLGTKSKKTKKKDKDGNTIYKNTTMINFIGENSSDTKDIVLDLKDDEYVYTFNFDNDDNIIALVQKTTELKSDDNSNQNNYKQKNMIKKFDKSGKELDSIELDVSDMEGQDGTVYMSNTIITDEGKIYTSINGYILIYDKDGSEILKLNTQESYIHNMVLDKNGNLYYCGYDKDYNIVLKEVDIKKKQVTNNEYKLPSSGYDYEFIAADKTYDFYIKSSDGLYGYILATQESTKIFDWLDLDINSDNIDLLNIVNDEIICNTSSYNDLDDKEIIKINKVLASDVKEKQMLTFATTDPNANIRKAVIDFNKSNNDYRIKLIDYSEYDEPSKQLSSDMVAGNIPDIVDVNQTSEQFISKGLLTDLYPFMEKDNDISKDDFIDEIINSIEQDGKLYYIVPQFAVTALIGHGEDIKGRKSWTIKDMKQLIDSNPKDVKLFPQISNQTWLYQICYIGLSEYVNWQTGECDFENQDFIDLLEFCNTLPNEEDIDYNNYDEMKMIEDIKNRKALLADIYLSDLSSYKFYKSIYGEDCEIIGYPTNNGTGIKCLLYNTPYYAITQKCENKEIAWEFIKNQLTYESQKKNNYYGLPIRKDALEKEFERVMATKEYVDEDGDTIYPFEMTYGFEDFSIDIKALKQKEVDEIKEIISRIDGVRSYSGSVDDILQIVLEEAKSYFSGKKSAQEVAGIIQNRVKIYISENM